MREILFRGKRLDTGEWVYGYYCKYTKRQVCPVGDELKPEDIAHLIINDAFADWNMPRSLQAYDVDPETVGQYTGLKDKNGVKIFEGDVINREYFWGYYIGYKDGSFVKIPLDKVQRINWDWTPINQEFLNDWEVVSNIHDNPEFLEVE